MAYVYILASGRDSTLYTGVASDLVKRIYEHKSRIVEGFTSRFNVDKLVWFERTNSIESAITREKQIKVWKRAWKIEWIEKSNPYWNDLYAEIV